MAELVDLERFRRKLMADKGFSSWLKRFQEQFGPETRLQDLSPATLLYLASPGEDNLYALFDLVMGAMGLGGSVRFRLDDLEAGTKLRIMDTAFALVDRLRFEVMRRLGWVAALPEEDTPLIALVQEAWRRGDDFARSLPELSPSHPDFPAYAKLTHLDRRVFLRRLIPKAVAAYRQQVEGA
ncbi:MAG: hypothetical protein WHT07_07790 [Desulfobaccales bacterium]